MDDLLKAAALGLIEGFTEFLPVSSTGHLIIANAAGLRFDQAAFTTMFDIVIQLGAILAVAVVFWKRLVPWGKRLDAPARRRVWTLWGNALIAFVPTGVGAFFLASWVQETLFNPWVVASSLAFYGVIFLFIERTAPRVRVAEVEDLGWKRALAIGAIQLLSLVPGTSRSGITIIGALMLGVGRMAATEFTFFLALPTMAAATGYSLVKFLRGGQVSLTAPEAQALAVGFVVSFLVAWAVIVSFLRFVQKRGFVAFGVYRLVLAGAVVAYFWPR